MPAGRIRSPLCSAPGFYAADPELVTALARYDFGPVFLKVRAYTGWSQQVLGGVVNLDQSRISAIERGVDQLRDVRIIAEVATGLGIPAVLLGFGDPGATVGRQAEAGKRMVSWVDRRDFGQHVAGLVLGAGMAGLDIDRLLALLPEAEPAGTRRIGAADVEVIEQITAAFKRQDFTHGSGLVHDAAVAQLHSVLPLLSAQITPDARPRLLMATAHLAMQTGYMSFDVKQHDAARRLWMIGLDVARAAEHPHSTDLAIYLLYDLALQAVHLGRPDEALHLVQVGHLIAGTNPASGSTTSCLASIQARAHAARGDAAACDRALGQAVEQFSTIDPATRPPWGASHDDTSLAAYQGAAHYTLALSGRDPSAAGQAVPLLRHAVDHFGPGYAKHRALYLPDLAGAHALARDTDTAVTIGHQAVDAITGLSSPRAHDRLRTLHTVLEPLHTSAGVAELRHRLVATAV